MTFCVVCGIETKDNSNYCSWGCNIKEAENNGGIKIQPNGLPIMSIKAVDSMMLEHEHGNHPDYKFPVQVDFVGDLSVIDPELIDYHKTETHALIYTDGKIAVTMYEACYAMWYLGTGKFGGGRLWNIKDYRLSESSINKIIEYHKNGKV